MLESKKISVFLANGNQKCEWMLMGYMINKGLTSEKFFDSSSSHFSNTTVWKTISEQVYGRQMCCILILVTMQIFRVTIKYDAW